MRLLAVGASRADPAELQYVPVPGHDELVDPWEFQLKKHSVGYGLFASVYTYTHTHTHTHTH